MKKLAWLIAALLATTLLLSLAACGGDDDDTDSSDGDSGELTENDLAEALLLVLEDLPNPAEWNESTDEPDSADEENPVDRCDRGDPPGTIGKADGSEFSRQDGTSVEQSVRIFESDDEAVDAMDFSDTAECVGDLVDEGELDSDEVAFSDFEFGDLDFDDFGDESRAYRLQMTLTEINPEEGRESETGDVYLDMVYFSIGTAVTRIIGSGIFEPYDPDDLAEVVQAAEDKMRAVLSGDNDDPTATRGSDEETDEPEETDAPTSTGGGLSTDGPVQTQRPEGPGTSPQEAVPLGESGTLLNDVSLRVLNVDLDAEDDVLAFNSSNVATPGKNMVVISVEVTNNGDETLDTFFDLFWNLVGAKGVAYDEFEPSCGLVPNELEGELTTGQAKTGNVCVQADEDDSGLVFFVEMFNEDFDIIPTYFALQ